MSGTEKDIVLTIDVVEPGLVNAVKLMSKKLGRPIKGLSLVHTGFADYPGRPVDQTGLFDEIIVNFDDKDELQKAIKPYADRILAVTTRYEDAIHHLRQVIPFLPYVNAPTESSLIWSTEKPLMRDRLRAYDEKLVPKYEYMEPGDMPKLDKIIRGFKYPVIVKPGSLWSSYLVTQCNTESELKKCLKETFEIIKDVYARERRETNPVVLIEEMMVGDMYSTDAYVSQNGDVYCLPLVKVITGESIGLPGFYSYRHIIPVPLTKKEVEAAFEAAKGSIRALNLRATTTHIELFYTKDGWKIIEIGARMGGYRDALYRESFGIEHYYNDIAVRAGVELMLPGKAVQHAAGINIYPEKEGIISSIEGIEEARKLESVVYVDAHANSGDKALFANHGGIVIVDGILSNKSAKKLEEDVAKVRKLVKINVAKAK